jgi:hypothetical protein
MSFNEITGPNSFTHKNQVCQHPFMLNCCTRPFYKKQCYLLYAETIRSGFPEMFSLINLNKEDSFFFFPSMMNFPLKKSCDDSVLELACENQNLC